MDISVFTVITDNQRNLPFYMETAGWQQHQPHIHRLSGYPCYHWLQTVSGAGELVLDGQIYSITPGIGFLLLPHDPHEYYAVREPWEVYWLTFDGFHIDTIMASLGFTDSCVLTLSDNKPVEAILQDIIEEAKTNDGLNNLELSALVYKFLICLLRYSSIEDNRSLQQYYIHLAPVLDYIKGHYMDEISLEHLASCMDITPQYLCRLFKEAFGVTPFTYLAKYRIKKAKELLLLNKSLTIREVSHAVGYNDVSYFCSLFRKYEGMAPGVFRKAHQ